MKAKTIIIFILCVLLAALFIEGCATKPAKTAPGAEQVVENGVGKARKFDDALDSAFRDALSKVVTEIIGEESEKENRKTLSTYMYDISRTFILSYEVTDKVKSGRDTVVYARVVFNRSKIEDSIRTLEIEIPVPEEEKDYSASPYAGVINEAIDNLTYLVYFEPEKKNISDEYARLAVNRVNNYFANQGYEYIELDRINEIKEEYFMLYEETQGAVSVVQLIAQALNADVYMIVDGIVEEAGTEGDIHFASASIDLRAFESATGRGLGTETGYSGKLGLASGMDAAKRKGVEVAVEKAIEPVVELARDYMLNAFEKGIRYEVVVQGIPSYGMLKTFTDVVRDAQNFRSLKEVAASAGQAKYYVYYMGRKSELIDDVVSTIRTEEGFENFGVLVSRGNAVVFTIEE